MLCHTSSKTGSPTKSSPLRISSSAMCPVSHVISNNCLEVMLPSRSAFRHQTVSRSIWTEWCHVPDSPPSKVAHDGLALRYVLDPHDPLFTAPVTAALLQVRRHLPLVAGYNLVKCSAAPPMIRVTPADSCMVNIDIGVDTPSSISNSTYSRSPSVRLRVSPSPSLSTRVIRPIPQSLISSPHLSVYSPGSASRSVNFADLVKSATALSPTISIASSRSTDQSPGSVSRVSKVDASPAIQMSHLKLAKNVLSRFDDPELFVKPRKMFDSMISPIPKPQPLPIKKKPSKLTIRRARDKSALLPQSNTFGQLSLQNTHETLTVDFKPCLQHPQLQQLQLSVWFRVLQLALLFLMGVLGNLAPVSLMSWWLLALVGVPTVSIQVPLFTQVDSVLLRRIVVMFDFHFTFFSSSLFLLGSIARDVLAFEALSAGSDVSMSLLVLWRMFGCMSLIFALMRVQCQDALLLDRVEKLWGSWLIVLWSFGFWLLRRALTSAFETDMEPSLCTPSGACFTLQRIRLDVLMSSIVFAGNCLRCLVFNADRFCMIKSTISLNVMTREIATNGKKYAKSFSLLSTSLHGSKRLKIRGVGSNAMLVTSSSRLIRRFAIPAVSSGIEGRSSSPSLATIPSSVSESSSNRLRLVSMFSDAFGSTSFTSAPMSSFSIPHAVWVHWACAAILMTLYLLHEPRSSWIAFAGVLSLFGVWILIILPWFHRSTLSMLMRNFEWWYLFCLSAFYWTCILVESGSPQFIAGALDNPGLVDSNGNSTLTLQTCVFLCWNTILTAFNITVISSDALISPSRLFKLAFASFNFMLNLGVAFYLCFNLRGLEAASPSLCIGSFCNSLFSMQIPSLWVISLFSLKYSLNLWYTPNALLILRAPITVSSF